MTFFSALGDAFLYALLMVTACTIAALFINLAYLALVMIQHGRTRKIQFLGGLLGIILIATLLAAHSEFKSDMTLHGTHASHAHPTQTT